MISLQQIIKEVEYLPPFSKVAQKAMTILRNDKFNMRELAEIVRYDPSLTANILKTVNSAYFGRGKEITDIFTAAGLLGRNKLSNLIMITAAYQYFPNLLEGYESRQGEIWEHSLSVALISEKLLFLEPEADPGEVFTAALLHDIGKVVLSQFVANQYHNIVHRIDGGSDFLTAEKEVLGFTHCEVGASVLEHWKFSKSIVTSALYYHAPARVNNPVVNLVALSVFIAMQLGMVSQVDGMAYSGFQSLLTHYKISSEQLQMILSDALDSTRDVLERLKGL